jgi:hypothetical protein
LPLPLLSELLDLLNRRLRLTSRDQLERKYKHFAGFALLVGLRLSLHVA